ncbi:MAG: hypothetical protein KZQ83_21120 [gamma proteobacterium symbiont of Taylorina sp.]|nr:hypothetical protein [gamma proteobacterium symbiont of Taylorina sp.]
MKIKYCNFAPNYSTALLLSAGSLLFSQACFSDATVVYKQVSGTQTSTNVMQIKAGKIRFTPPNQNDNYSLYDSKTGTITHVDITKKHYLSMTEEDMMKQADQAKKQMEQMRQRMMEKMKDMPPEQKKQVEAMMNNHLSRVGEETIAEKIEQKKTSRTENITGIQCTVYESYIKGLKVSEVCMSVPHKLGLSTQDTDALMSMQEYMKRMQKMMSGKDIPVSELKGIPLHTRLFAPDGSIRMETHLESISTDNINSIQMSVPEDFSLMK